MAGFSASKGKIIITLDGDLEHDPADIPKFLSALQKYDLVIGWQKQKHQSVIKYIPSRIFNFLNNNIFNLKIHDADSGYRGMKSEVAKNFNLYGDLYRFIPALASQQGYRIGEVQTNYRKRLHGRSKYGGSRLITGAMDMLTVKFLTDFNQKPLHLFGLGGLIFFLLGFIIELFIVWDRVYRNQLFSTHMPLLILGILLMILGINLLGIGLVSELISSSQKTPRYRIKEVLNLNGF